MNTQTIDRRTAIPLWVRGDVNAFFGLGTNVLSNVIVLTGLCVFVLHLNPQHISYGAILPALGIELSTSANQRPPAGLTQPFRGTKKPRGLAARRRLRPCPRFRSTTTRSCSTCLS
jgi:hypothetical protein